MPLYTACDHLKACNLLADNFKNTRPRWWACDMVRWYWSADTLVLTVVNWSQHGCVKSGCTYPPIETARLNIGVPVVQTDGRSGGRCTVTWLPNFLGWVDLLSYGAPLTRARGAPLLLPNMQLLPCVTSADKRHKWNYCLFLLRVQQLENWTPKETRPDNIKKNINF